MRLKRERENKPSWIDKKTLVRTYERDGKSVKLYAGAVTEANKMRKKAEKDLKEANKLIIKSVKTSANAKKLLKENGLKATDLVTEGDERYWTQQRDNAQDALSKMKDVEKGSKKWVALKKKISEAEKKLKIWSGEDEKGSTSRSTNKKDRREQAAKRLAELIAETEKEANEIVLSAMKDGREKKLKEIDDEYKQRKEKIQKRRKELIQLEKDLKIDATKQFQKLNENEVSLFDWKKSKKDAVNTAYNNEATKEWEELLKKYKTYENEKTEILKQYATDRAKLEAKNKDGEYNDNISKLNKEEAEKLFVLEKSAGKIKSTIAEVFSDLSGKSIAELRKIQVKAEGLLSFLESGEYSTEKGKEYGIDESVFNSISSNPESLKAIRDLISDLRAKTKTLGEHFKTLFKKDAGQDEFEQSLGEISKKLQAAIQLTNLFADSLRNISGLSGSKVFGKIADGISNVADVAGSVMSGAQAGLAFGVVGAQIGAGLGLLSSITGKLAEAEQKHREAINKIKTAEINQQREYNRLLFEQKKLMKDKESIFGTDEISKAVGYLALYNESFQKLQNKFKKVKNTIFSFWEGFSTNYQSELDKIKIKTGHKKTGLFGWGKGKDIYSSITDKHPDLIKANGEFNKQRAETLLKEQQFAEGSKEALQEIINLYDQAKESEKLFNDYLQETFGELGSGIVDSVTNALQNGEDAFENFAQSVGNVMGKLGKQIMYELFVSSKFKEFQKQLKGIIDDGNVYKTVEKKGIFGFKHKVKVKDNEATLKNIGEKMRDAVGNFANSMKGEIESMKVFAEIWQKESKNMGFDVWQNENENTQRSVASKGIAQASQDSIDEVLGRLNALVRFVNEMREADNLGVSLEQENISIQTAILENLIVIADNTSFNKFLSDIYNDVREIREQGLKMKM